MDPIRETRARRMVLDPSAWPQRSVLHMKNMNDPMTFGVIEEGDAKPDQITIRDYEHEEVHIFDSLDAMIAAGWTTD
jgi:hypothetical protein